MITIKSKIREFDKQDWDCYSGAESWNQNGIVMNPLIRYSNEDIKIMWVLIGDAKGIEVMLVDANGGEHGIFHLPLASRFLVRSVMKNFPDRQVSGEWLIENGFTQIM